MLLYKVLYKGITQNILCQGEKCQLSSYVMNFYCRTHYIKLMNTNLGNKSTSRKKNYEYHERKDNITQMVGYKNIKSKILFAFNTAKFNYTGCTAY